MDVLLKVNAQRAGRDKLFRILQYSLKIIGSSSRIETEGKKTAGELEKVIGSFRKLLRWGTCVDTLSGVRATLAQRDPVVRATSTFSRVAMSAYLLYDHLVWLHRQNLFLVGWDGERLQRRSDQWWLAAIAAELLRDCYEIRALLLRSKKNSRVRVVLENKALFSSLVLNLCDICLPMSSMKIGGPNFLSPSFVGVAGVVSSVLGMLPIVDQSFKR